MIPLEPPSTLRTPPSSPPKYEANPTPFEETNSQVKSQKLPAEVISHIFHFLSSNSLEDLKTCTRVSQIFYEEFSKILYKRLHIKTYEVPIKMKLMMRKFRRGYYPFTEEDEESHQKFIERRLQVVKRCEYIRFEIGQDVRNTIRLIAEFQVEDEPFGNIKHMTLNGPLEKFDMALNIRDEKHKVGANRIWEILEPSHICINMSLLRRKSKQTSQITFDTPDVFEDLSFIVQGKKKLESITYHNHVYPTIQLSDVPIQKYYYDSKRGKSHRTLKLTQFPSFLWTIKINP